jgi:hypothetical protein
MSSLSNSLFRYYHSHFDELAKDKQFHFASRLHLWDQEPAVQQMLNASRAWFTGDEHPEALIQRLIADAQASPIHGSRNASGLREQYFLRYPNLKTYALVILHLTFLKHIYNLDCRELFFSYFPKNNVLAMRDELLRDDEALAILSTHAINFLYLLDRIIQPDEPRFDPSQFITLGSQYELANPLHLQLKIYLYTHCIIGETLFYYRALPTVAGAPYHAMMAELETLISERFADINLDNKFEFLVCAQITGFESALQARIFDEAERSVSPDGTFLIDRHNNNPQAANNTLGASEHRNVLFIMANNKFTPVS